MSTARVRLAVSALVFFGWLGWLGYLAASKTHPVVVSRSQAMAAARFVVATVNFEPDTGALSKTVTVTDDLRPAGKSLTGDTLKVPNLEQAEIAGGGTRFEKGRHYLLMLSPLPGGGDQAFELTRPPGRVYHPPPPNDRRTEPGRPWAYRWDNEDVRRQFEALVPKP